ncbi:MAG: nitrogenase component 1 [Syntrophomonadaceae bacterium]|nr:nitrogenase component 1 [Syntrophomonadaceae bacterium]
MPNFVERARYYCSMGGAMSTATALPDTVPILHAAGGCAGNITWAQNGGSGLQVGGYCGGLNIPSSNVQEKDIVFGGDRRLREQIQNTLEIMDGKLFVVITSCVTEIIGDDVRALVNEFKNQGVNIISAETGGFKGNSYYGYDLVLQALIKDYLHSNIEKRPKHVNVLGIVPYMDIFWRGNLEGIRSLLEKLGLKVNTFFTGDDSLDHIREAAQAELNIVVSDIYGVEAAEVFQETHGTPYVITPLPIGPAASDLFLRKVGQALEIDDKVIEAIITQENRAYYNFLDPLVECYNDLDLQRNAVIVGDANYAPALTRFLADDLGWIPKLVVFTDQLVDSQKEYFKLLPAALESGQQPRIIFETDTSEIIRYLSDIYPRQGASRYQETLSPGFVIGSSLDRELASSLGAPHLSISFPVANRAIIDRGYTGYRGGLRLMEDLLSAVIAGR